MTKTVIGLFDEAREAQQAVDELQRSGFTQSDISVTRDANDTATFASLRDMGVPSQDVDFYTQGVKQGGALVIVRTADDDADRAADILAKYDMVDIDSRMAAMRQTTTSTAATTAQTDTTARTDTTAADGTVIPIVEEELNVGKRQVQRGGVRIHTSVSEKPVEANVQLRDETVRVERRAVDRPVTDADLAAMKDSSLEVTETDEEAVVAKTARVVEEVVVDKQATERTETIRDTVRRTDVDVEQIGANQTSTSDDSDFRTYYTSNLASSGSSYEQYQPGFTYGTSLASDKRYTGQAWTSVESNARTDWEAQHPGTWEQFKGAVQYAWERASGKR